MRVNGGHLLFYGPSVTSRQFVPKFRMVRWVYPPSPLILSAQPGVGCQGCVSTAVLRRLALDGRPRLCYFPARGGGISSRAAPFPKTGKGRGVWVERLYLRWRNKMNFTNSPYEKMMKEMPKGRKSFPMPEAPRGTPCKGCPYWRGISCAFCYREHLKKQD